MERAWNSMMPDELAETLKKLGEPAFRAKQIFHFFHAERGIDLNRCTTLPKAFRARFSEETPIGRLGLERKFESKEDKTAKYLLSTEDGHIIETVWMPYEDRNTLCVSCQIGCRMGCKFCASTKARFGRNLTADEILQEVYTVERDTGETVDNIVMMGIGEPLDNYDEVLRFIRLVTHPDGKNLSARSITVSTCGIVPNILRLADEGIPVNLAISLHNTTDAARRRTMPIANQYTIEEIVDACKVYFEKTGRRVSFEYVLIRGENDSPGDVERLSKLAKGPGFHVNLIPLNEIKEFDASAAERSELERFRDELTRRGVTATIRQRRGADIDGACGQLRIDYMKRMELEG